MKISKYIRTLAIAGACSASVSAATLSFNLAESGDNVTLTVSGAISDLTPWSFDSNVNGPGNFALVGGDPVFFVVYDPSGLYSEYTATTSNPISIGTPKQTYNFSGSTTTSVRFAVTSQGNAYLGLPRSYSLGTNLSGSAIFENESIQSLGFDVGNYSWTFGADTFEVNVVPEPSSFALLSLGAAGLLARRRRVA